jgi:hypothetical protein
LIDQVTKKLTGASVVVVSLEDEILCLRIVSDTFQDVPRVRRFKLLADLFETHAPEVARSYSLAFEAWTTAEAEGLGFEKTEQGAVPSVVRSKAAKGADL